MTPNPAVDKAVAVPDFAAGKMNRAEAGELFGDASDPAAAPGSVRAMGPARVVISLGVEGAVAACGALLPGALRSATAAGAATAASCGSSVASRAAIEAILSQVSIEELGEVSTA